MIILSTFIRQEQCEQSEYFVDDNRLDYKDEMNSFLRNQRWRETAELARRGQKCNRACRTSVTHDFPSPFISRLLAENKQIMLQSYRNFLLSLSNTSSISISIPIVATKNKILIQRLHKRLLETFSAV